MQVKEVSVERPMTVRWVLEREPGNHSVGSPPVHWSIHLRPLLADGIWIRYTQPESSGTPWLKPAVDDVAYNGN